MLVECVAPPDFRVSCECVSVSLCLRYIVCVCIGTHLKKPLWATNYYVCFVCVRVVHPISAMKNRNKI